ncbi:NAD(P)H-dependent glycerol-3-phosphate dehydrogenase [Runella slithyformis]|uniref:Glycerol-3-phosphate dehydrogenase n=1 Tax=Runella slithyformis (strain ATCC 29530 / DSM 19594 / LMG 11500 / NCIMB 11436 / LSU 4) TaxID=761193 RepID=A0A7U4E7H2_RUNSL|nr:NAD(P)H-dependent glycerol-3-phosphate dehydrogenase [Runella slithyformis]AEI50174.1 Glycerol-3-phosphate dehydrogenase (NAD(P)(+)) [Runella slithyformis DSM 19594]
MTSIAVIGGGSWATAIIKILSENNVSIRWWLRDRAAVDHIRKHHYNPDYLRDVRLSPRKVKTFTKIADAINGAEYIILAIPAAFVQEPLSGLTPQHFAGKRVVSAIKGMIPTSNCLVTDWVEDHFEVPISQISVIAGPCHAEEVALEKQSYLTIASTDAACAADFSQLMSCRFVTANPLTDLYGVEYAAVMKNIVALTCGISHGLGYGDNFQAVLVSNAMQEIRRFVDAVDPRERDLSASAYLGDLLVTAYSQFSRNRTFGNMIGRGYSVQSAQMEMKMIAEGYYAVNSIFDMNKKYGVEMPITEAAYKILYERQPPAAEIGALKRKLR